MESLAIAGQAQVGQPKLAKAQGELDAVAEELAKMQVQFDEAMAHKQALQDDADATTRKMDAANRLIGGLSGERKRWGEQSEAFADEIRRLAGDVALACAFIGYVGPFNADAQAPAENFRGDASPGRAVTEDLGCPLPRRPGTIGDWMRGLPSDELSVENGIMVALEEVAAYDRPAEQGMGWIKSREAKNRSSDQLSEALPQPLED